MPATLMEAGEVRLVALLQEYDESEHDDRKRERVLKDLGELMVKNQERVKILATGDQVVKPGWGVCGCGSKTPVSCSKCSLED